MASLDGTVVRIALPAIGKDFGASFSSLQWTINAYTLTLAGFLLLGGSLGDHYGRRRVFPAGVVWFGPASLLSPAPPAAQMPSLARPLTAVGPALVTPATRPTPKRTSPPTARAPAAG